MLKFLTKDEVQPGIEGIFLASESEAKTLYQGLRDQNLRLAVITPVDLNLGVKSEAISCRVITGENRVTIIKQWITNFGTQRVTPKWAQAQSDTPKIAMRNDTVKIILQVVKKYCSPKEWKSATENPGAALRDWLREQKCSDAIIHSYRLVHKDMLKGGAQWIEQVIIVKPTGAKQITRYSGISGVFAKPFVSNEQPPSGQWHIVWMGEDTSLVQVLQKGNILGDAYKGLAHGRNGLGVRVLQEDYADCGKKMIPDFVASTDNSFMYEISKVPIWVNADDLIGQLMATMGWMVDFVRTLRAQGGGNIAAPQDCMLLGDALLLIQKARPAPRSNVSVSYFGGANRPATAQKARSQEKTSVPAKKTTTNLPWHGGHSLNLIVGPESSAKRRRNSFS